MFVELLHSDTDGVILLVEWISFILAPVERDRYQTT